MKAKNFISVLRKVIREEVRSAVRQEIGNIINENKHNTSKKKVTGSRMSLVDQIKSDFKPNNKPNRKTQRVKADVGYSSNPILNDILNETANQDQYEEYPTMNNRSYNSNDVASMLGYESMTAEPAIENMVPKGVNPDNVTDDVANALTRDYTSLMKAIDKKKGIK